MKIRPITWALCLSTIALGLPMSAPVAQTSPQACAVSPSNAVVSLPAPLSKWAEVLCTPYGEVIIGHDGWVWLEPIHRALVVIPSTTLDTSKPPAGNAKAHFTKVEMKKIDGEEFDRAYAEFHVGIEAKQSNPTGYRLDLSTVSGDGLQMYFFDYKAYGWGISCPNGTCDPSSRFVIVNVNPNPKPLPPAI